MTEGLEADWTAAINMVASHLVEALACREHAREAPIAFLGLHNANLRIGAVHSEIRIITSIAFFCDMQTCMHTCTYIHAHRSLYL